MLNLEAPATSPLSSDFHRLNFTGSEPELARLANSRGLQNNGPVTAGLFATQAIANSPGVHGEHRRPEDFLPGEDAATEAAPESTEDSFASPPT